MVAFFEPKPVDFRPTPTPSISAQAVELEESILGAILLDPGAIAAAENLPIQAFSISAHQAIYRVMLDLHRQKLQPDLPTVAFRMSELGILKEIGGQPKLASLLDRIVHSGSVKQYVRLLQDKYYRRYLSDSFSRIAQFAETEKDIGCALTCAHEQLEKIKSVAGDTLLGGDTPNVELASFSPTVTTVTQIIELGLSDWEEQAHLDALQAQSGISKASFAHLVTSLRCQYDEVTPSDEQQLDQLIDWKNATLDYHRVLPHLASDLLHDGRVLNIDPIMLWQYLLPATLSLVGKKVNLDVGSHKVPAIAWTCSVGESGTGKSRAEGLILSPLKGWQEEEYKRFKASLEEYKASLNKKAEENGEPVSAPVPERKYLFEVATIQAVMRRLSEQGENGSLWARDELAGLFKSLSQFTAKGEGEGLECLLPMWDGVSAPVDRVLHEDSYFLVASRLGLAGGLQPGVFRKIFTDPEDAQGIQARFLFALPKVQPARRVKGYCQLADKLPQFYRWVDTRFPSGTMKLSSAADARYDAVYEQIGHLAENAETLAVRAWMRKLPGQLLRIAIALHIIECYHEPGRPKHEIQLDTLNRAVDFCRYYRSAFQVVQQSVSDSDSISSILLKIWDKAATSPEGLAVRDAYRNIKALDRRAKELGRNVGAYTIDLYYQLQKMGKGIVQKCGRVVRFVAGIANAPTTPGVGGVEPVPVVTVAESQEQLEYQMSLLNQVSPVTERDIGLTDTGTDDLDVPDLSTAPLSDALYELPPSGDEPDDSESEEDLISGVSVPSLLQPDNSDGDGATHELLSSLELQGWLDRMRRCANSDDCIAFLQSVDQLAHTVQHQILEADSDCMSRFWEAAEIEPKGKLLQNPGVGFGIKEPPTHAASTRNPSAQPANKSDDVEPLAANELPLNSEAAPLAQPLKTGLWVRCFDGFHGYLGSRLRDGRWWVVVSQEP